VSSVVLLAGGVTAGFIIKKKMHSNKKAPPSNERANHEEEGNDEESAGLVLTGEQAHHQHTLLSREEWQDPQPSILSHCMQHCASLSLQNSQAEKVRRRLCSNRF
jgi:hypothetical protein